MEPPTVNNDRSSPESNEQDLLSNLPNEILVSIIDKLEVERLHDVAQLRLLSRRWRCLPDQLPKLTLNIYHFLPPVGTKDDLSEATYKMAVALKAMLAQRRRHASDLQGLHATLAMEFYLTRNSRSLGRLLEHAVATGEVHAAELTITTRCSEAPLDASERAREAMAIYGRRFRALFDACPAAFGALKQLRLESVRHDWATDFPDVLATCTRLEKLSLHFCFGLGLPSSDGRRWEVRHARLTDITVHCCGMRGVDLVSLPRLERFTYRGWSFPRSGQQAAEIASFGHVPHLTTITLCHVTYCEQAIRLSRTLANSGVKALRLNFRGSDIWVRPEISRRLVDVFRNLKDLKIRNVHQDCGLTWIMLLLQSAPQLQELYIKLKDHNCGETGYARKKVPWEVATDFEHSGLSRVVILGFYNSGQTIIVAFIRRLAEAAPNLKEICIREDAATAAPCAKCEYMEPQGESRFPRTHQDIDTFREKITCGRSTAPTFKIHIQPMLA